MSWIRCTSTTNISPSRVKSPACLRLLRYAASAVDWEQFEEVLATVRGTRPRDRVRHVDEFAAVMASYSQWSAGERGRAREQAAQVPGELGRALERWQTTLRSLPHPPPER